MRPYRRGKRRMASPRPGVVPVHLTHLPHSLFLQQIIRRRIFQAGLLKRDHFGPGAGAVQVNSLSGTVMPRGTGQPPRRDRSGWTRPARFCLGLTPSRSGPSSGGVATSRRRKAMARALADAAALCWIWTGQLRTDLVVCEAIKGRFGLELRWVGAWRFDTM